MVKSFRELLTDMTMTTHVNIKIFGEEKTVPFCLSYLEKIDANYVRCRILQTRRYATWWRR